MPIYVITTAKKRNSGEWFEDGMKMSLRSELHVDSWNNIGKYVDCEGFFIFDEQKIAGNGVWVDHFQKIAKKNPWIVLSATPADVWIDLVPILVANGYFANRTEFNNQHVRFSRFVKYPKVDRYIDEHVLYRMRDAIYVEMAFERHTVRNQHLIKVDYDRAAERTIRVKRWNEQENRPIKDAAEMTRLLRTSTNLHWSRYKAIRSLSKDTPKLIVFYNHNPELEVLRGLTEDLDIEVREWNGHKHEDVPTGDRWIYLVQYQAGAEAWNCITTDSVAFYSLPYSYKSLEQARGRIDRMNTPFTDLNYYILISDSTIDRAIWKTLGLKKKFQASAFGRKIFAADLHKIQAL